LLANNETADTVGAVVNAGGITTECDITGELVDLVPKCKAGTAPGLKRQPICRSLNRTRHDVVAVEEGFEDGSARTRIAGMCRRIGWVCRTSLGEGDG